VQDARHVERMGYPRGRLIHESRRSQDRRHSQRCEHPDGPMIEPLQQRNRREYHDDHAAARIIPYAGLDSCSMLAWLRGRGLRPFANSRRTGYQCTEWEIARAVMRMR